MTFLEYVEEEVGRKVPRGSLRRTIKRLGTNKPQVITEKVDIDTERHYYDWLKRLNRG